MTIKCFLGNASSTPKEVMKRMSGPPTTTTTIHHSYYEVHSKPRRVLGFQVGRKSEKTLIEKPDEIKTRHQYYDNLKEIGQILNLHHPNYHALFLAGTLESIQQAFADSVTEPQILMSKGDSVFVTLFRGSGTAQLIAGIKNTDQGHYGVNGPVRGQGGKVPYLPKGSGGKVKSTTDFTWLPIPSGKAGTLSGGDESYSLHPGQLSSAFSAAFKVLFQSS